MPKLRALTNRRMVFRIFGLAVAFVLVSSTAFGQDDGPIAGLLPKGIGGPADWTSPSGLASTLQVMLLLTVVSLAPAILLMTTGFVRIIVVLGLLRQALGTQQFRRAKWSPRSRSS